MHRPEASCSLLDELLEYISNSAIAGPKPGCEKRRGDGIVESCVDALLLAHAKLVLVS